MIRFIVRAVAFVLLAGAFVAVVMDGTRSIAADRLIWSSGDAALRELAPTVLDRLGERVATWPAHALWQDGLARLLALPAALLLALVGMILFWIVQPRKPPIGVVSRR